MPDKPSFLSYDLHIHSCLSPCADDDMTPGNILGMAALIGLDIIALTDHNSCKNCPAIVRLAEDFPLQVIPGMELTTAEEVHVLCYFCNLEDAISFDTYVEQHLLPIPNQTELFGNQLLCDEQDNICGTYENLLITATDISFFQLGEVLTAYNGFMVPAHMDKKSNSLLSQLGFVPENCGFTYFEVHNMDEAARLRSKYPILKECEVLCSSDAHRLDALHEKTYFLKNGIFPV